MNTLHKLFLTSIILAMTGQVYAIEPVKLLRVFKSERRLELLDDDNHILKTYKIMLGLNPEGTKKFEGDNKTPEGTYSLDYKNPDSKFHKAFHISYPKTQDIINAKLAGKPPGGNIMLHGYPNNFNQMQGWLKTVNLDSSSNEVIRAGLGNYDWTNGCISVTDAEIDEIYSLVSIPTKIIIYP